MIHVQLFMDCTYLHSQIFVANLCLHLQMILAQMQAVPDLECSKQENPDTWVLHELVHVYESRVDILLVDATTARSVSVTKTSYATPWGNTTFGAYCVACSRVLMGWMYLPFSLMRMCSLEI
jgi:hypothetical protein